MKIKQKCYDKMHHAASFHYTIWNENYYVSGATWIHIHCKLSNQIQSYRVWSNGKWHYIIHIFKSTQTITVVIAYFVSALSFDAWGLEYSVEMYSVLLSQETFLACCRALKYTTRVSNTIVYRIFNLFESDCCASSSSSKASSAWSSGPVNIHRMNDFVHMLTFCTQIKSWLNYKSDYTPPCSWLEYVSGNIRSIGTPKSISVKRSCLWFRSKLVEVYWMYLKWKDRRTMITFQHFSQTSVAQMDKTKI